MGGSVIVLKEEAKGTSPRVGLSKALGKVREGACSGTGAEGSRDGGDIEGGDVKTGW